MKNLMATILAVILTFIGVNQVVTYFNSSKGVMDQDKWNSTMQSIQLNKDLTKSSVLAVEIKDPVLGGTYTIQRAQAISTVSTGIKFENDYNNDFVMSSTGKDKLQFTTPSTPATVPYANMSDSTKVIDPTAGVQINGLLNGYVGIPKIIPEGDEIQKQMVLGLCSLAGSAMEKNLLASNIIGTATTPKAFLTLVFDGTADVTAGTYKGLIGLQLLNPMLLDKSINGETKIYKNYIFYEVCEVKSETAMKTALATIFTLPAEASFIGETVKGLRSIQEGTIIAIPQNVKSLVKDVDGIGIFSLQGRLKRN